MGCHCVFGISACILGCATLISGRWNILDEIFKKFSFLFFLQRSDIDTNMRHFQTNAVIKHKFATISGLLGLLSNTILHTFNAYQAQFQSKK